MNSFLYRRRRGHNPAVTAVVEPQPLPVKRKDPRAQQVRDYLGRQITLLQGALASLEMEDTDDVLNLNQMLRETKEIEKVLNVT